MLYAYMKLIIFFLNWYFFIKECWRFNTSTGLRFSVIYLLWNLKLFYWTDLLFIINWLKTIDSFAQTEKCKQTLYSKSFLKPYTIKTTSNIKTCISRTTRQYFFCLISRDKKTTSLIRLIQFKKRQVFIEIKTLLIS